MCREYYDSVPCVKFQILDWLLATIARASYAIHTLLKLFTFNHLGVHNMNTNANKPTETAKNYSDAQVIELTEYVTGIEASDGVEAVAGQNHNLASAKAFAEKFGKSYQSVISKIKNLELAYDTKPAPRKKAVQATKSDLVDQVQKMLDRDLSGLEKANRAAILALINGIQHVMPEPTEPVLPEIGDNA